MELSFDVRGNLKQKEAAAAWCDNTVSDIVYGGSKGSGKSCLGTSLVGGDALIYPGTHYFIARKKLSDLRKFTIPSFHESMELMGIDERYFKFNSNDNYFRMYNGSMVYFIEAKYYPSDPTYARFGSMQMTRGMVEEAGEFEEDATSNLMASIGRWKNGTYGINGKVIQTCNPAKNYLYKKYYLPSKQGQLDPWKRFIQALPQDNKMLPPGYIDHLFRILNKNQRERLLYGNWEYDDDPNTLCAYETILAIFENDHLNPTEKDDYYLTADIARHGSDKAIIAVWHAWTVVEFVVFDKSKTTEIEAAIKALRVKYAIPKNRAVADEDGVGGGVVDHTGICGFINGSSALPDPERTERDKLGKEIKDNYFNLQTQCGYLLAGKINAYAIHIAADLSSRHQEEIIEELEYLKTHLADSDGKLRLLPKEKIKEAIGRSPDWLDTLRMRCWFDLQPFNGKYVVSR